MESCPVCYGTSRDEQSQNTAKVCNMAPRGVSPARLPQLTAVALAGRDTMQLLAGCSWAKWILDFELSEAAVSLIFR